MGSVKHNRDLWAELVAKGTILQAQREDFLEGYRKKEQDETLNNFVEDCRSKGYTDEEIKKELKGEV